MWKQCTSGFILSLVASAAFAFSCPGLMDDVDAALDDDAVVADLSGAELARVRELREEGQVLHSQGNHEASEAALHEAQAILGID